MRDVGLAEELAQEALVAALEQWPVQGLPRNPAAWLMTTARRRAVDVFRRHAIESRAHDELLRELEIEGEPAAPEPAAGGRDEIEDDLLRLVFIACHPLLSTDARVALTLRLLGGLSAAEIARAFLVPEATIAQRIVRAKRTLAEAQVPFEVPRGKRPRHPSRLGARGRLPDLQRRLLGDLGRRLDAAAAVRRGAAPRPHPRGAGASRAAKCMAWSP